MYYILYTIYYILYSIYYILYTMYYILYTIYYILYTIYDIYIYYITFWSIAIDPTDDEGWGSYLDQPRLHSPDLRPNIPR